MKKVLALALAAVMVMALCGVAFADDKTITVNNAMNGQTYTIYKLFDATTDGTNIAYTLPTGMTAIPTELEDYFELKVNQPTDITGVTYDYVAQKSSATFGDDFNAALKAWATGSNAPSATDSQTCTTGKVEFTGLTDGYYVIVSDFDGTVNKVIGTSTTNGGLTVYEKNTTVPQPDKTVDEDTWSIGDTITYTVTFPGANYMGQGDTAKIVTSYTVEDTLPPFLSNVTLVSVTINGTDVATDAMKTAFADPDTKAFDIPWAKKDESTGNKWQSLYNNGTEVTIVYTAVLTDVVNVGTANINTVTVTPNVATPEGTPQPWEDSWHDQEEVYTYGAAVKKVDESGNALSGAKFAFYGLTVTQTEDGVYTVVGYNGSSTDLGDEMTVNDDGMLYIIGLDDDMTLTGQETEAPVGYNKLNGDFTLTIGSTPLTSKVIKTEGYAKYDSDGNLIEWDEQTFENATHEDQDLSELEALALEIENKAGAELPATGGIGTTIFYVSGLIMVLGASIILVSRRRADAK
ncbi:MAG: isopeptide-forming domain-containing fimbrial protein [Clostridia bacterium]|nr:isopeptide-forming domain-containing fimbrial protein [Clostridia bacterium]